MSGVVLRRAALCGFGLYTEPACYLFGQGLNVLVAPNEAGKTTLVLGMAATLFGLPDGDDPSAFTVRRFRNWDGAGEFWGEIEFEAGGGRYMVRRSFADHRVTLLRLALNGAPEVLFDGVHDPLADPGPSSGYLDLLNALLRVCSSDVFYKTFCITQPMPQQGGIDRAVQGLVSGSANRCVEDVLSDLFARLAVLTSEAPALVDGAGGRLLPEGRIEALEREIADLEARYAASRDTLIQRLTTQHEIEQLERHIAQETEQHRADTVVLAAWERWQQLRNLRDDALDEQCRFEHALEEYAERDREYRALRQQIEDSYPEYADARPDTSEQFLQLQQAERTLAELRDRLARQERQRTDLEHVIDECERTIQRDYATISAKPDLLRDYDQLREALERLAALRRRLANLERALGAAQAEIDALLPWGTLGSHPRAVIDAARERVRRFRASHRDAEQVQRRVDEVQSKLTTQYAPFADCSNDDLASIERYDFDRQRLLERQREAAGQLSRLENLATQVRDLERELHEQYGRLLNAPHDLVPRLERACRTRQELDELVRDHAAVLDRLKEKPPDRRWPWIFLVAVLGGIAGWVAGWQFFGVPTTTALVAVISAFMGGSGVWLFSRRPEHDQALQKQRLDLEEQMGALERSLKEQLNELGSFADVSPMAIGRIQVEIEQRDRLLRRIELLREQLPDPQAVDDARVKASDAQRELDAFEMRMERYVVPFGQNVGAAARACQRLREEQERLQRELQEYAREFFDTADTGSLDALPADAMSELWTPIRALARVTGAEMRTARDMVRWVLSVRDEDWAQWLTQCDRYEQQQREKSRLDLEMRTLLAPEDDETEIDRLEQTIERLRQAVLPFDETVDRQTIEMELLDLRAVRRQLEAAQARLDDLGDETELMHQVEQAMAHAERLRNALEPFLRPAGGDVERARRRYDAFRELVEGAERRAAGRDGLLRGCGAADTNELDRKRIAAQRAAEGYAEELETLRRQQEFIRELESLGDPDEVQRRYLALRAQTEAARQALEQNHDRLLALIRRRAELEGRTIENLARLEQERARCCAQRKQCVRRRDALVLAYRTVGAARREYLETYRDRLAESVSSHFAQLSRNNARTVALTEDFTLDLRRNNGEPITLAQLSQGARDQLYLAVRLAVADLLADAMVLPLVLDDPFVNYDQERLPELRRVLERLAQQRQVILLSHRTDLLPWGRRVERQLGTTVC